jgi:hypothetical protein
MSSTSEEHRAELERFSELLSEDAYQTELAAAAKLPYDALVVRIETFAEPNRVWSMELSFLPGLEDELKDVSILQCYVALANYTAGANSASLERLIIEVNAKLPIGAFGLLNQPRVIFFKHNALLPNDDPAASDRIVHELVPLTSYLLSTFSDPLIKIATGVTTAEAALAVMPFGNVIS